MKTWGSVFILFALIFKLKRFKCSSNLIAQQLFLILFKYQKKRGELTASCSAAFDTSTPMELTQPNLHQHHLLSLLNSAEAVKQAWPTSRLHVLSKSRAHHGEILLHHATTSHKAHHVPPLPTPHENPLKSTSDELKRGRNHDSYLAWINMQLGKHLNHVVDDDKKEKTWYRTEAMRRYERFKELGDAAPSGSCRGHRGGLTWEATDTRRQRSRRRPLVWGSPSGDKEDAPRGLGSCEVLLFFLDTHGERGGRDRTSPLLTLIRPVKKKTLIRGGDKVLVWVCQRFMTVNVSPV